MPMEFSGDSYPKLPVQQNDPLGTIGKLQGIEQQGIAIDREKLAKYNEQYNIIHRTLGNLLATPEGQLTADSFMKAGQSMVNQKLMTPEQYAQFVTPLPTRAGSESDTDYEKKLRQYAGMHMLQAQEKHDAIGYFAGKTVDKDAGNQTVFGNEGRVHPTLGGLTTSPFQQQGPSLGRNPAPGTPGVDQNNNPTFQQGAPPQYIAPPSSKPALPVASTGGPTEAAAQGNAFRPAPSPGFSEGVKARNEDQDTGKRLSSTNVQALQAYKLIQGLRSGPTTGPWNEAVAALKANHIIPIEANDPTAIYEEANKKLSQIVQAGGQRSDAALAKSEESSPSVKTQINPALVKLTRDLIAQNRTEIVLPNEFESNDYSKYGAHRSTFATKIEQKAAGYDLLPKDEKVKIWKEMKEKKDTAEGKRFFDTLRIMRKHNQFDPESLGQ